MGLNQNSHSDLDSLCMVLGHTAECLDARTVIRYQFITGSAEIGWYKKSATLQRQWLKILLFIARLPIHHSVHCDSVMALLINVRGIVKD